MYGKSEFESVNAFPDPRYVGNFIGLVKNERIKHYNSIPVIVQAFIPYNPTNTYIEEQLVLLLSAFGNKLISKKTVPLFLRGILF
ncbi:hypothetical protein SAMN05421664_3306 [Chryseobacterium soldanellicola]|uniref:Uncharacterized protein n=1 Tax=Chryseobacterium soldanellicola TaxID=311333 RepID=A0A1H1FWE5_9FLAO|nr:hypothetical protein [Chryseobacterium soldanellicola]SDR05304.1 hypothetical protein SAMN05421664_3306 [Chryseobacterium soldanellicola]